jgi:hypothetical protein
VVDALLVLAAAVGGVVWLRIVAVMSYQSVLLPFWRFLNGHAVPADVVDVVEHNHSERKPEYAVSVDFTTPSDERHLGVQLSAYTRRKYAVGDRIVVAFDPTNPQDARAWHWPSAIVDALVILPILAASGVGLIVFALIRLVRLLD